MKRTDEQPGGTRKTRVLPIVLSVAVFFPSNPFVTAAAAQVLGAQGGAFRAGAESAASVNAGGASAATPAPLSLTPLSFTAPLSAGAPSAAAAASALAAAPALSLLPAASAVPAPAVLIAAAPALAAAAASAPALAKAFAHAASDGPAARPRVSSGERAQAPEDAKLGAMFDGGKSLDPESVKVFLVRHGQAPVATTLATLGSLLKAEPDAARSLNKNGGVRLVLGNADGAALAASAEFKSKYPSALGLNEISPLKQAWDGLIGNPIVKLAVLPFKLLSRAVNPAAKTDAPVAPSARPTVAGLLSLPGRAIAEARFLGRTFRDSFTKPLTSEVLGGIATKSFPLATSIGVYWTTVGMSHPLAMAGLMALSLTQEVFHGIFLNTWNNFQESLSRMRGFSYQMYFNLAYMQGFGALYRALSWSANPHKTIPPWSPFYWKDVMVMSLVGTFFGTLGYNGLNTLYAKGRLKRWQRSGIQQLRDVLFLLAGPFFATGSMHAFWALFIFQQALDFTIALIARRAQTRTILYVAAEGDMAKDTEAMTRTLRGLGVTASVAAEKLSLPKAEAGKGASR
jgi:hypothetical protein